MADGCQEARFGLAGRFRLAARLLQGPLRHDPVGDLAAEAQDRGRTAGGARRRLDPGDPADAIPGRDRLVDEARAVGAGVDGTALDRPQCAARADQILARAPQEPAIGLVGEEDAPGRVAQDDEVELRFDQAAVLLLAFGELPNAVLETLDMAFERHRVLLEAQMIAQQHDRHDEQRRGERPEGRQPCACTAERCEGLHCNAALFFLLLATPSHAAFNNPLRNKLSKR